jgi:hypothetical protein
MQEVETTDALLEDPGDLAEPVPELTYEYDTPEHTSATITPDLAAELAPLADDAPTHKAVCMVDGCPAEVVYRTSASGAAFILLERRGMDLDATLGMGSGGRPICPIDGHGEMTVADETIPVGDAFAQVAEKLNGAQQVALPGVFPAFNYAGAFNEIVDQAKLVERLNDEYDDAKKEASEAKKNLDKGAELLMRMTLQFEQRRREKPEPDGPSLAAPRVITCVWDQAHPDDACPLCDTSISVEQRAEIVRVIGAEILPTHANAHADQVVIYRTKLDVAETVDALAGTLHDVHVATVAEWTPEQRAAVRAWVTAVAEATDIVSEPVFPAELGRPHRAAVVPNGDQAQRCVSCSETIKTFDDKAEAYEPLARVGLDCAGEERDEHRYPERMLKAKRARRTVEAEPAPVKKVAKKPSKKKGGR